MRRCEGLSEGPTRIVSCLVLDEEDVSGGRDRQLL